MSRTLMLTSDPAATVSDGEFFMLGGTYLNLAVLSEDARKASARIPGHFCFLGGRCRSGSPPTGQKLQFRKNGADGAQLVTLATGWAETADQDGISDGDLFDVEVLGGTSAAGLSVARAVFSADAGVHATYHIGWMNQAVVPSATAHFALAGDGSGGGGLAEAQCQTKYTVAGTIANLQIYVLSNPLTGQTTLTLRINGANGASKITIPAGGTGLYEDLTHSDSVADGDLVSLELDTGAGSSNFKFSFVGATFTAQSGTAANVFGTTGFRTSNFTGTKYIPIGGYARTGSATEADVKCRTAFPATLSRLGCYVSSNSRTDTTTVTLRINGADGNCTFSIPAGSTGWFSDDANNDIVAESDDVDISITTAAALASFGISAYGLQIEDNGGGTPCNSASVDTTGGFLWVMRPFP